MKSKIIMISLLVGTVTAIAYAVSRGKKKYA